MEGYERPAEKAAEAGFITQEYFEEFSANLPIWFSFLEETGAKKGDEIVTVGGIIGTIVHLDDERLTVKTAENTRLLVERGKVGRAVADESGTARG